MRLRVVHNSAGDSYALRNAQAFHRNVLALGDAIQRGEDWLAVTLADEIRELTDQGLNVAEIARRLNIRYSHAYNVLKHSGSLPPGRSGEQLVSERSGQVRVWRKPPLSVDDLIGGGFAFAGRWVLTDAGQIALERPIANAIGVYAFAVAQVVVYVGVATIGLAKRLYFYTKPGPTQPTNLRLNQLIKTELAMRPSIDIYTAVPGDLEWNGLPVNASAGLELGLIQKYALPWNKRSAG